MSEKSSTFAAMFAKGRYIGWLFGALCLIGQGCSSGAVQEAEHVVAQADSLRTQGGMYGIDEGDSARLAQAYETLGSPSLFTFHFSPSYARACYHYGRLLREKDDPVAAMQVFINATHSRTRDYAIIGRIYSNMGSICHLAGEYDLSYDMYERSGEMYLLAQDTLLYYYDLNNMAYELAEQKDKDGTIALLEEIEKHCHDQYMQEKVLETKAEMYLRCQQYDTAIYCVNRLNRSGYNEPTGTLIKAQAFSYLGINDSAIYYADMVLDDAYASPQNRFNALYVLSHNDTTLCTEEIRDIASQREDIRYYEYEPKMEKLTQAIHLLRREIKRTATYRRIRPYIIIAIVILLSLVLYGIYRIRNRHHVYATALQELNQREKDLTTQQMQTQQKQNKYVQKRQALCQEIENRCKLLRADPELKETLHWRQYNEMCQVIDSQFYMFASKLRQLPEIKDRDVQLCVLVLLDFNHAEIAKWMYVEEGSVGKLKERTAKKFLTSRKNMRQTLLKIVIGDDFENNEI